jgi:hypothetical protein
MRTLAKLAFVAVLFDMSVAHADEWTVRREAESGQCSIQKISSHRGSFTQLLAKRGNLQAACAEAKSRYQSGVHMEVDESDGADAFSAAMARMCSGYISSARGQCHGTHVNLP